MSKRFPSFMAHRKPPALLATALLLTMLGGCDLSRNTLTSTERSLDYNRQDMRQALAPRPLKEDGRKDAPIPGFESYVADPALDEKPSPLVTIAVNQSVPLRDIFFELSEQADVDIEIDTNIRGSIIFSARKRPFNEVMERISDLAGLRYTVVNGVYRVERDTPYLETYKIDYLGLVRNSSSNISYSVSIGGGGGGGGGGGSDAGGSTSTSSGAQIDATFVADFWSEIDQNIKQILSSSDKHRTMSSGKDPAMIKSTPLAQLPSNLGPGQAPDASGAGKPDLAHPSSGPEPSPAALEPQAGEEEIQAPQSTVDPMTTSPNPGLQPSPETAATTAATPAPAPAPAPATTPTAAVQQPAPSLTLQQSPASDEDEEDENFAASFTINRQSGTISVFAPRRQHRQITKYLQEVKKRISSQVLIEARVLEVSLTDEYAAGIDWNTVNLISGNLSFGGNFIKGAFSPALSPNDAFNINYTSDDLTLAIDAISRFGTVHAVSSPRMTVLNNQMAILNVAENIIFFEIDIEREPAQFQDGNLVSPATTTVDTEAQTVPEGLIMTVTPSIDLDTQEIVLALRPTLTRVTSSVADPAIPLGFAFEGLDPADFGNPESLIPQLAVQEMDSVVRIRSGSVLIMGGLMSDRTTATEVGVPVLSDIPLLGAAFRSHTDEVKKTELVIFLKATIIPSQYTHETDRELYNDFSQDRRPFNM